MVGVPQQVDGQIGDGQIAHPTGRVVCMLPLGWLTMAEAGGMITALERRRGGETGETSALLHAACDQLAEYFAGKRQGFDLPLDFGTGLQRDVRRAMVAIPYGETRTYGDVSRELGIPARPSGRLAGRLLC